MLPKKENRKASSRAVSKKSFEKFDPKNIGIEDRFLFNLKSNDDNVAFTFSIFICELRCNAALGGSKFKGKEFDHKLCLGDAKSYKNPFMIASVCFAGHYLIEVLIYKPNVKNVGFCINNKWWRVRDFSRVTGYSFTNSNELDYGSSYPDSLPNRFSFYYFQNTIVKLFISRERTSFYSLCVILCETMKFDEILRVVGGSFGKDENGMRNEVELSSRHTNIISSWTVTSGLWYLYDMGFKWDPLGWYPDLVFQDVDSCSTSLGLAMKVDEEMEDYIEKLRNLSMEEREEIQRRPIQM